MESSDRSIDSRLQLSSSRLKHVVCSAESETCKITSTSAGRLEVIVCRYLAVELEE